MVRFIPLLAAIWSFMLPLAGVARAQTTYKPDAGLFNVEVVDETWRDESRSADPSKAGSPGKDETAGREIPVRVYVPVLVGAVMPPGGGSALRPVVVFSHGMGGSREGYEYIARHLATHGYLVILPQHPGSDKDAILKAGKDKILRRDAEQPDKPEAGRDRPRGRNERPAARMLLDITEENTSDPANLENRPEDISFALDHLAKHARFGKIVDMTKVAVAGHSFGAYTTMAICGMRVDLPERPDSSFRDERVKVGIAMSPQGKGVMGVDAGAWDAINVPMLLMTGTRDMGQGDRAVAWRHEPFQSLQAPDSYFLNIIDANHMTFSGSSVRDRTGSIKEEHLAIVRQCCTAFLDACLLDDAKARAWLREKQIVEASGKACEFRHKLPAK